LTAAKTSREKIMLNKHKAALVAIVIGIVLTSCSARVEPERMEPEQKKLLDITGQDIDENKSTAGQTHAGKTGEQERKSLVNPAGSTIDERFNTPESFNRLPVGEGSFGVYLRSLPLKPDGSKVKYYNGKIKPRDVHEAVIDIDVGDRDLQQCADAVMRLRAEYLYSKGLYDKIHFNFTNGFNADYSKWIQGNRIVVEGNKSWWVKKTGYSNEYKSFRQYMDMVFAYAGTVSLSKEMKNVPLEDIKIGDVFLKGDLPGHCVIIVDMAEDKTSGEKLFMVAQSYMPAQDIHILKNLEDSRLSPWYTVRFGEKLSTPEWEFTKDQLYRFED
jgi:hypothetical protein